MGFNNRVKYIYVVVIRLMSEIMMFEREWNFMLYKMGENCYIGRGFWVLLILIIY